MRQPERPSERVERQLRELVAGMAPGAQLPTVRQLATDLQTSGETVRRVLGALAADGLVTVIPRWGVFVAE